MAHNTNRLQEDQKFCNKKSSGAEEEQVTFCTDEATRRGRYRQKNGGGEKDQRGKQDKKHEI